MNKFLLFLGILLLFGALIILGPCLIIWSLNVLFHLGIPVTFETWFAVLVLSGIFKTQVQVKK